MALGGSGREADHIGGGSPLSGLTAVRRPERGMQPTEDMHAQANIHNLGRRTRDVADVCVPPEPSDVIQEVSFSATFSKF